MADFQKGYFPSFIFRLGFYVALGYVERRNICDFRLAQTLASNGLSGRVRSSCLCYAWVHLAASSLLIPPVLYSPFFPVLFQMFTFPGFWSSWPVSTYSNPQKRWEIESLILNLSLVLPGSLSPSEALLSRNFFDSFIQIANVCALVVTAMWLTTLAVHFPLISSLILPP